MPVPVLDDDFAWAAQSHTTSPDNRVTIDITLATNQSHPTNIVTYAEGTLTYQPGSGITPPSFASDNNGIVRYHSDKRTSTLPTFPFDPPQTDRLTVSIKPPSPIQPSIVSAGTPAPKYTIAIKSQTKPMSFSPTVDASTHVLCGTIAYDAHGTNDEAFITVTLCNRLSKSPL